MEADDGDFDKEDFAKAKPAHWKKFWKKIEKAKLNGVEKAKLRRVAPQKPIPKDDSTSTVSTTEASPTSTNK